MKIALISAADSIHIIRWANSLSKEGNDVTVICCPNHFKSNKQENYCDEVKIMTLPFSAPYGYFLNLFKLKSIVRKSMFDVINIHYASGYGTLGRLSGLKNAMLNIWGSDVFSFPYQNKFSKHLLKKNLKYYKYIASTSNCMAEQSNKFVNRPDMYITPFGVDTKLFKVFEKSADRSRFVFGTVKSLDEKYGITDTVNAFITLCEFLKDTNRKELFNSVYYEIYGKGPLESELNRLIVSKGYQEKIKLCGFVQHDRLPEILNGFDVFCCNSIEESFGVAVVEAMACGLPVIVSDAPGLKEVVEDCVTGIIVPKHDVKKISEAMNELLTDKGKREAFGKNGTDKVKKYYNWDNNVSHMLEIYKKICLEQKMNFL